MLNRFARTIHYRAFYLRPIALQSPNAFFLLFSVILTFFVKFAYCFKEASSHYKYTLKNNSY